MQELNPEKHFAKFIGFLLETPSESVLIVQTALVTLLAFKA